MSVQTAPTLEAITEARERVRSAVKNSGFNFPLKHVTCSLAPADLRKEGPSYDLPMALGVLIAVRMSRWRRGLDWRGMV